MVDRFLFQIQQPKMKEIWHNECGDIWDKNPKCLIIGITGSIGSGKTTAAKLFSKHGYNRIDADEIGHQIITKNSSRGNKKPLQSQRTRSNSPYSYRHMNQSLKVRPPPIGILLTAKQMKNRTWQMGFWGRRDNSIPAFAPVPLQVLYRTRVNSFK